MSRAISATTAKERADIAAEYIRRSDGSVPQARAFNDCFEMNDGDEVRRLLYARAKARPNTKFARNLPRIILNPEVMTRNDEINDRARRALAAAVTRYAPTYINKDGQRTLMRPAQGRNTFETREAAQAWLDAVRTNTPDDAFRSIYGHDTCEVRAVLCWPVHFDPIGVYFSDTEGEE